MRFWTALGIAALTLQSGCSIFGSDDGGDDTVRLFVAGVITSEATGEPIPGATVELIEVEPLGTFVLTSTTTNAAGEYSVTSRMQAGCGDDVWLEVNVFGFETRTVNSSQPANGKFVQCTEDVQDIDITLAPRDPEP